MRVVAVCPLLAYPGVDHAGGEFAYRHLDRVSRVHDVVLVGIVTPQNDAVAEKVPASFNLRPLLHVPGPGSRFGRLRQRALGRLRWQVLWLPARDLRALFAPVVDDLRAADVVELHWGGWLLPVLPTLRRLAPHAVVVIVPYDVPWQAYARRAVLDRPGPVTRRALACSFALFRRWQVALFERAEAVLVLKDGDGQVLRDAGVRRPSILVVDPPLEASAPAAVAARRARPPGRTVLFTGAFDRPENHFSALWFLDNVWPEVRARAVGARLVLGGGGPPPELWARATSDVIITGYLPSLAPLYAEADVFVAPLLAGAGLKFKVPQAMRHGLAVVATHLAAEGVVDEAGPDRFGAVTDDPAAMADALVDLLSRPDHLRHVGEAGRRWAEERYDFAASTQRVLDLYGRLVRHRRG